jgi:hypothetical protein
MAKLSDRQKANIIAKFKTGIYTNIQLAKTYKISESMVRKICDGIGKENAHIVEAQTTLENAKKCELSAIDNIAINQAVKYNLDSMEYKHQNVKNIHEVTNNIISGIAKLVEKGKAQKVVTEGQGMGVSMANVIEHDMQPEHYEKAMNTIDKASITLGVNSRFNTVSVEPAKGDTIIEVEIE